MLYCAEFECRSRQKALDDARRREADRQKRSRANLERQRATLAKQEDKDLKENFPVQPSLQQQLESVAAFREAVSQPLLLCGCCTRELFPDEGIKAYKLECNAMKNAKEKLVNVHADLPAPSKCFPGLLLDDDAVDQKNAPSRCVMSVTAL